MLHSIKQNQTHLTLETLQALSPIQNGSDIVTRAAREILLNRIHTEGNVHRRFFSGTLRDTSIPEETFSGFPVDRLSVAIVAEAISKCNDDYKFHCTIEKSKLEYVLSEVYDSLQWKKLGFKLYMTLYPIVVQNTKHTTSLQDYIDDDGPKWAERLIEKITQPGWTALWVKSIIRGYVSEDEYNAEMNALFVKLHLLDPQSVIPTYHLLNNIKALPKCNLELATRNYLGGRLDSTLFVNNVKRAIMIKTCPSNSSILSLDEIESFLGIEVEGFILSYVRDLGVWNGRRPDNRRKLKLKDRCSIM